MRKVLFPIIILLPIFLLSTAHAASNIFNITESSCSGNTPIIKIRPSSGNSDTTYRIKRSGSGYKDFLVYEGKLYNQSFIDGEKLSLEEGTKYSYSISQVGFLGIDIGTIHYDETTKKCSEGDTSSTSSNQAGQTTPPIQLKSDCSQSGDPLVTVSYPSAAKDKTYIIKRSGSGYTDFEVYRGSLFNQVFTDGQTLSLLENTPLTYKIYGDSNVQSSNITTSFCNKPAAAGQAGSGSTTGSSGSTGSSSTPTTFTKDNPCWGYTDDFLKSCNDLMRPCISEYDSVSLFPEKVENAEMEFTKCTLNTRNDVNNQIIAAGQPGQGTGGTTTTGQTGTSPTRNTNNKPAWEQLQDKARSVNQYKDLIEAWGAWCGVYGGDCDSSWTNTCSEQLKNAQSIQVVSEFTDCIKKRGSGTSGSSGGSTRSGGQAAPAGATSSIPRITTPQANITGRRIEILNAWCAAYLGASTAKGDACVDKARDKCKQTDEEEFTNCVKGVGGEMQRGTATQAQPTKAPYNPDQSSGGCKPGENRNSQGGCLIPSPGITLIPTVDGYERIADGTYAANITSVVLKGKVFETGDASETCVPTKVELILYKTHDEKGAKINPNGTRIVLLKDESGRLLSDSTKSTQNCEPYTAILDGVGKYSFRVKAEGKSSPEITFNIGGTSTRPTAEPKLFSCTTTAESTNPNYITASVSTTNTDLLGYDRVAWYIKKGGPTASDQANSPQYKIGENYQFGSRKDETYFGKNPKTGQENFKLEPGNRYTVLAVAYPSNLQRIAVPCGPLTGVNVETPNKQSSVNNTAKIAASKNNSEVLAATTEEEVGPTSAIYSAAISCDGACYVTSRTKGFDGSIIENLPGKTVVDTEVVEFEVNNIPQVDYIEVTAISENADNTISGQTINIPVSHYQEGTPTRVTGSQIQNITLSKNLDGDVLTNPERIILRAVTDLPVTNPSFINAKTGDKYVVLERNIDLSCATTPSANCTYEYTLLDEFTNNSEYSMHFASGDTPFEQAGTLDFTISIDAAAPSAAGGIAAAPGTEIPTKITISVDGSEEQVLFTRDQNNPDQVYYATIDFDLTIGKHDFIYRVYYNFSEENPYPQARIIERLNPETGGGAADGSVTCGEEYAKELGRGRAQNVKDCSDNTQPTNGEIYCIDPSEHLVGEAGDEHCESGEAAAVGETGQGATTTAPEQSGARVCTEGEYTRKCIQGTRCQYEVYLCNQNDLEYKGPEEDCKYCPDTREECHNEDEELSPGCFQSYSVCPDGSKTPNGGPWSPNTGEACTPQ